MDISSWTSRNVRDCGTQVRQPHLASHLQNFEVKHKTASPVSEKIKKILLTAHPTNRTRKKSTQTERYDPWDKNGNMRSLSIKTPSEACVKEILVKPQPGPSISKTVVLNSRNKRKYCDDLIAEIKNQAEFDKIFENVGHLLEKRIDKNVPSQ